MFRCSRKKIEWYLSRNLARILSQSSSDSASCSSSNSSALSDSSDSETISIQLTFDPKGLGRSGHSWYLEDKENRCVVCGSFEDGLTLHHVVPYQYRKHMPVSVKSHSNIDTLPLCLPCHASYEVRADKYKLTIAHTFDSPLQGRPWVQQPRHHKVRRAAGALLKHRDKIPSDRLKELENLVKQFWEVDDISQDILEESVKLVGLVRGEGYQEHGEIVVQKLLEEQGKLSLAKEPSSTLPKEEDPLFHFIKSWRIHFLEHSNPACLSPEWNVDEEIYNY